MTLDQIRNVAGPVEIYKEARLTAEPAEAMPSPGVGLRHYAPRARLILVEAPPSDLAQRLSAEILSHEGARVGIMLPDGVGRVEGLAGATIFPWGRWDSPDEMARRLYSALRSLDAEGCQVIVCPLPPAHGIGAAIRDRLRKAART